MPQKQTGKIILLDRIRGFGFIESPELDQNTFFHRSGSANWESLEMWDTVEFEVQNSMQPKHLGKPQAKKVTTRKKDKQPIAEKFGDVQRWVGILTKWDAQQRYGYLEVESLSKKIFFKHTTAAYVKVDDIQQYDLFVVHPADSSDSLRDFFTQVAYPLALEIDVDWLKKAWSNNKSEFIRESIEARLSALNRWDILWKNRCEGFNDMDDTTRLEAIVRNIGQFKTRGYIPSWDDLNEATGGDEALLLTLWLRGETKHYKPERILDFFVKTNDDWRTRILDRLDEQQQIHFLSQFSNSLAPAGYLNSNNPRLRYVLQTAKRLGDVVRGSVLELLDDDLKNLSSEEKIHLSRLGLWDEEEIHHLLDQVDLKNTSLLVAIIDRNSEQGELLTQRILQEFLKILSQNNFNEWHSYLIPVLQAAEKRWPELMSVERRKLQQILSPIQIYTIGLFGLENFLKDDYEFIEADWPEWPMYALIRYVLTRHRQNKISTEEMRELLTKNGISQRRLSEEITQIPWSQILQPCLEEPCVSYQIGYIEDVDKVIRLARLTEISVTGESSLATHIFQCLHPWQPFHPRLWLQEHVPRSFYDYDAFREPYKRLSREEKRKFRKPSKSIMENTVGDRVTSEIPSCNDFVDEGHKRIYYAKFSNLHFGKGEFQLKTPTGFTEFIHRDEVTYGFNFMALNSTLRNIKIEIHVQGNSIVYEKGIEQVLHEITWSSLQASLLKRGRNQYGTDTDPAYTDDFLLQEQILYHLKSLQTPGKQVSLVYPHVFEYEVDEDGATHYNPIQSLCGIFTVDCGDSLALIWEFFDLQVENATYVFKVTSENYDTVLGRLIEVISTRSGVRSVLSSSEERAKKASHPEDIKIFRQGLGYVGNFRIKRGKKNAFAEWEKKFRKMLKQPVLESIGDLEWENILKTIVLEDSRMTGFIKPRKKSVNRPPKEAAKPEDALVDKIADEKAKVLVGPSNPSVVARPSSGKGKAPKQPKPDKSYQLKSTLDKVLKINDLISNLLNLSPRL